MSLLIWTLKKKLQIVLCQILQLQVRTLFTLYFFSQQNSSNNVYQVCKFVEKTRFLQHQPLNVQKCQFPQVTSRLLSILHTKRLNSQELNPSKNLFSLDSDLFFGILQGKINKFQFFFQWSMGMMDVYSVLVMPTLEKVDQWWVQMNHQSQWELYQQPLLGFIELSKRKKQGKVEKSFKLLSAVLFNALQGGSLSNG